MHHDNYFVLTGAMGSGKSAIIEQLINLRLKCVLEPARQILHEQRVIFARGVPEIDSDLFTQLMLSRATSFYLENFAAETLTVFDRGIPDMIAYADYLDLIQRFITILQIIIDTITVFFGLRVGRTFTKMMMKGR